MIPIPLPEHVHEDGFEPDCPACREIIFDPFGYEPEVEQ